MLQRENLVLAMALFFTSDNLTCTKVGELSAELPSFYSIARSFEYSAGTCVFAAPEP
jgi:hypothetical protein